MAGSCGTAFRLWLFVWNILPPHDLLTSRPCACSRVLHSFPSDPPLATVFERALMERAARVLQKNKFSKSLLGDEDVVRALWFAAAGKVIHAHTSRVRLVRKTLVVEVEDSIWQRQLRGLSEQILTRVRKLTGQEAIADLEFRVGVPRRLPQRSQTATGAG